MQFGDSFFRPVAKKLIRNALLEAAVPANHGVDLTTLFTHALTNEIRVINTLKGADWITTGRLKTRSETRSRPGPETRKIFPIPS
jgi:hypothetical protein